MKIIGLVPARRGSKRFPGKNLAEFEGIPLIVRAVDQARRVFGWDGFFVSTDYSWDELDRSCNHDVPGNLMPRKGMIHRPASLAEDETPMYAVVLHAALSLGLDRDDWVCLLQPTCPLRTDGEIMRVVARAITAESGCYSTNRKKGESIIGSETELYPACGLREPPEGEVSMPLLEKPPRQPNGSIYCLRVKDWARLEGYHIWRFYIPLYLGREEIDINTPEDLARAEAIAKGR